MPSETVAANDSAAPEPAEVTAEGCLALAGPDGARVVLHPLWLRERGCDPGELDPDNNQRLFEPCALPADLAVREATATADGGLAVAFSDGSRVRLDGARLLAELGWRAEAGAPPAPTPWTAATAEPAPVAWRALDAPEAVRALLHDFLRDGYCLLSETPTDPGSLAMIARRFGFLRETNFGPLFDVMTKPSPSDLAYTGRALSAHADNPYRHPVPGIQLLHCLESTVAGGDSTLVDGLALVERLAAEMPDALRVLETLPVRFRYDSRHSVMEASAPIVERGADGRLKCLRFSPRIDYVPPADPRTLSLFYAGRRRLFELAGDPAFEIRFRLAPGMVLMMDNLRLLHGRTGFDESGGRRHLQGCYIDHDGPESLYRQLARGDRVTTVGRDVA